jgi:hypothetical protein
LQQAQDDEQHGRQDAYRTICGQDADQEGRQAHDDDGDQEGVLAPYQIAKPAKYQRAEWPDGEAGGEGEQGENEARGGIDAGKEVQGDDRCQRSV